MSGMLQISLLSLSKPKMPLIWVFQGLLGAHGRWILPDGLDKNLSTKKCVPCNAKDLQPMTEQAASDLVTRVEGWNLIIEDGPMKLNRSWKVKSFTKGLELFKLVADVAEAEDHHPDLHLVGWNNVTIEIWTHSVGGLTENDFILAAKINALDLHHLLRKKVAK